MSARHQVPRRHRFLIRKRANFPFNPPSNIHKQAAKPENLSFQGGLALKPPHELLIESSQLDNLVLQRGSAGLLLLAVLAHGLTVTERALLRGALLGRFDAGVVGRDGWDDLGVDMEASVGVGEVGAGRIAGVGVSARMVVGGVFWEVIEEALDHLRIGEIEVGVVHGLVRDSSRIQRSIWEELR